MFKTKLFGAFTQTLRSSDRVGNEEVSKVRIPVGPRTGRRRERRKVSLSVRLRMYMRIRLWRGRPDAVSARNS